MGVKGLRQLYNITRELRSLTSERIPEVGSTFVAGEIRGPRIAGPIVELTGFTGRVIVYTLAAFITSARMVTGLDIAARKRIVGMPPQGHALNGGFARWGGDSPMHQCRPDGVELCS